MERHKLKYYNLRARTHNSNKFYGKKMCIYIYFGPVKKDRAVPMTGWYDQAEFEVVSGLVPQLGQGECAGAHRNHVTLYYGLGSGPSREREGKKSEPDPTRVRKRSHKIDPLSFNRKINIIKLSLLYYNFV